MLDEPVHLTPHRAAWDDHFAREHERLADALATLPDCIVHIGSTAVPDLPAKPVVDIMIGADVYPPPDEWVERLVRLAYEWLGEAGVAGRWYFRNRSGVWTNVHVVLRDGTHWRQNLALRDYLRQSATARQRYAAAKQAAVDAGARMLIAYSHAKGQVVQELIAEALQFHDRAPMAGLPPTYRDVIVATSGNVCRPREDRDTEGVIDIGRSREDRDD